MGKLKKKGKAGTAVRYMTRNQATKKLQVTLKDFRRLCILKGIYPREPKNKKAISKSSANKTYYSVKDIGFLAHEPILGKFREFKAFVKKLRRALGKNETSVVNQLKLRKPVYTLDHLVKERYPTFMDALVELDDALCLIFLFAQTPKSDTIQAEIIEDCRRLSKEFMSYIARTHSLRKVFLSVKGIYYQADIMGTLVTWITPYGFSQHIPRNVDCKVMLTFLEFYRTLLGFANYKLYTDINLNYPPRFDSQKDANDAGLSALILESNQPALSDIDPVEFSSTTSVETDLQRKKTEARLKTLNQKIRSLEEKTTPMGSLVDESQLEETKLRKQENDDDLLLEKMIGIESIDENEKDPASLFKGFLFFLNREVPKESLEFVIKSFGGDVVWEDPSGAGFSIKEDDSRITHHVVDRQILPKQLSSRDYVQPQYVYDCVNSFKIMPTFKYSPTSILPPHLSPFVDNKDKGYDPLNPFPTEQSDQTHLSGSQVTMKPPTDQVTDLHVEDEVAREEDYRRDELSAEMTGLAYSDYNKTKSANKPAKVGNKPGTEDHEKKLAEIMMRKKDRRLYRKIQHGEHKKTQQVKKLQRRRREIEASKH